MPKCDACGFAHAQPNHCINCGNSDPFRRHRLHKLLLGVALVVLVLSVSAYFHARYTAIENSVRQAQMGVEAEEGLVAPKSAQP